MSTLYELTTDMQALLAMMEDPDVDMTLLADTMEATMGEIEVKADGYGMVIRELEAQKDVLKGEIKRMNEKAMVLDSRITYMKKALMATMDAIGKRKIDGQIFHFSIQKNGGALPVIIDVDPEDVPEIFQKVTRTVDTQAVAKYLKEQSEDGELVDWAHFGSRGESLRMK